jgi:hypothetical protein
VSVLLLLACMLLPMGLFVANVSAVAGDPAVLLMLSMLLL